ncbi:SDR family NAD(P)-dependent oxidoreductase [Rhodococcus sp. ABRD24]|uniref:SDR family NAD(P)-dependent oxidoreductase n=1 Tax=Rhodococcus sp. ABRD24 TaxID=2507582 RepID=UPI00103F7D8F|nr:SDR family NAD(P)-dependent oxidoreductase [Rhodococcus sp. ABRD24]QBJ96333.1 SDR family NAD(P)-dependent oxidoreductase [Rhodococcus sp. ABRD24]
MSIHIPSGPSRAVHHPIARAGAWAIGPRGLRNSAKLRHEVEGKVVVITGASFGVGEATAALFAKAGARVVLAARSIDRLREVTEGIVADGGQASAYPLDLTSEASVSDFAAAVLHDFGGIDYLIHNAGKSLRRSIHLSYDRPKDVTATTGANYVGPMRLTLALLPGMRARGRGHIVNVSTVGIMFPVMPKWSFYLSSKAAFDWWLRAVGMEARTDGVTLTTFYAGLMHTRMSAPSRWMRMLPGQTPDDAAKVIARAVVNKPRTMTPIYGHPSAILVPLLRLPLEIVIGAIYRRLGDTPVSLARVAASSAERTADRAPNGSIARAGMGPVADSLSEGEVSTRDL